MIVVDKKSKTMSRAMHKLLILIHVYMMFARKERKKMCIKSIVADNLMSYIAMIQIVSYNAPLTSR